MADLFVIGASGTKAYRASMAAVSENIANASNADYSRRTVRTTEVTASGSISLYSSSASFGGVTVSGVERAHDPYLTATARLTGQQLASVNQRQRWGTDIETALRDDELGIGNLLADMHSAITQLSANPTNPSLRSTLLFSMEQVATAFNQSAQSLETVAQGITDGAAREVSTLNDALSELAYINDNLMRAQPGTANEAELLDSRDAALTKLTERMNATVSFGSKGTVEITYDGQTLVSGVTAGTVATTTNADGTLAFTFNGTTIANPSSGSLGGLSTSATLTRERRAALDDLASQFATSMNDWHANGLTDAGNAGGALFSGTTAATLAIAITSSSDLATASSDGRVNGNLVDAATVLRGTGSVEQNWTALVNAHANLLATTNSEQSAMQARNTQAQAARDAISGVDLDMEAADLLRFQQAYSGCARIIQVARETVDAILNIF